MARARVAVRVADRAVALPPSDAAGHLRGDITLTADEARRFSQDSVLAFEAAHGGQRFQGVAMLVPAEGLTVITDIDDTIKDSDVAKTTSVRSILSSLFRGHYYGYQSIDGMAELYRRLAAKSRTPPSPNDA